MPSSIIEEPRARSAKTVRPPQRPAGSSSVPSTGKAWKGRPAATVPRRGIVTADPTSTATASHPALVAARMIPLLPGTPIPRRRNDESQCRGATGGRGTLRQASMARGRARQRCDMRVNPPANLLITGPPGIGKTTVPERVTACLPPAAAPGFVTRELRARGVRQGFVIETLDGRSALLASVRFDAGPRVGRYRVHLAALDTVAVPAPPARPGLPPRVGDQIGQLESPSPRLAAARPAAPASRHPC